MERDTGRRRGRSGLQKDAEGGGLQERGVEGHGGREIQVGGGGGQDSRRMQKEVDSKREELRVMVGERYR